MAYEKGSVHFSDVLDTTTADYEHGDWFWLPHSCNSWVIGTNEDALNLIEDLKKLIEKGA